MSCFCAVIYVYSFALPVLSLGLAAAVPRPAPLSGLFSVVQFPNDACTATSGLTGTCVTSTECRCCSVLY